MQRLYVRLFLAFAAVLVATAIPAISQQDYPPDSWDKVYISEYTLGDNVVNFVVSNENDASYDASRWKVQLIRNSVVIHESEQLDCVIDAHSGQVVTVDWQGENFNQVALLVTRDGVSKTRVASQVPGNMAWWWGVHVYRTYIDGIWGWGING